MLCTVESHVDRRVGREARNSFSAELIGVGLRKCVPEFLDFPNRHEAPRVTRSPTDPITYSIVAALSEAGKTTATPMTVAPSRPGSSNRGRRFLELVRGRESLLIG